MSKLQYVVTTLTMESEYVTCHHSTQQTIWHRAVLMKIELSLPDPTSVHIDNTSAQSLADNPVFYARSKHVNVILY